MLKTKSSANGGKLTAVGASTKPKPELTKAQQFVADEVAELLLHGGREEDLDGLLSATLSAAQWRLIKAYGHLSAAEKKATLTDWVSRQLPEHRLSIMAEWRACKDAPGRPSPKTVTERIRAEVMDQLQYKITEFLSDGSPEEQRLLYDVLDSWAWIHPAGGHTGLSSVIALAQAFSITLGRETAYVKVPEHHVKRVELYVRSLEVADNRAA